MKSMSAQAIKNIAVKFFTTIILFFCITSNVKAQCDALSPSWCTLGNSGTTSVNFLGTIDPVPLIFKVHATEWMRISPIGNVGIFTTTPAYKLDVVGDINLTGALRIGTAAGTAGQVLTSSAGGANTWTTPSNGTITSVTGTAPIISSGGNAPAISIAQANASTNGFLSSTDWTTFNNKVAGSGTLNYLPKWTPSGSTLGNSLIFDNGTNVGIGTATPGAKLEIAGQIKITSGSPGLNKVLTSDATGLATWTTPTTGTLTSITAGTGLAGGVITSTGTISLSIPVVIANGGTNSTTIGSAGSVTYSNGTQHVSTAQGTSGQVLTSAGAGAPIWITPTTGTITSVTGTAPIISSGGATPDISITQSGISTNGFLSSTDWNTFNNKLAGSGTFNYVPKWTPNGATLGNSSIFDNGNVGIGTTNPLANFEVKNGNVLFDGTTGSTPISGPGTRMMWISSKGAFRAGVVNGAEWDNANIGKYSAAFGVATTAESYACFVVGRFNRISALYSKTTWVPTDPLFVVGNGQNSQKTGNALTVLKNGNVGIGTPTPINRFDVSGEISIGGGYAGVKLAPVNGAIIRGKVGIGTPTPKNQLDIQGGVAIGATYAGIKVAPVNGAIIKGKVGVGTETPVNMLDVEGGIAIGASYSGSKIAPANGAIIEGNVGIGTNLSSSTYDPTYKLAVNGKIRAKRIVVETTWSDFVFEKDYKLTPLAEVEQYIKQHGHLSEMPSAKEVETNGGDLGNLVKLQMQKIEELTLYAIEQNKKIDELSRQIKSLKK